MKDFVAIDFETANRNYSSVCSVGIVIVKKEVIVDRFYQLIKPEPEYYSYLNSCIHGLTQQDTCHTAVFPFVWRKIEDKIKDLPLIAHNKRFDEKCLKEVFKTYDMDYPNYTFYCTLIASRRKWKNLPNYKLGTVASYCGFDLTQHHHALADAEACAAIALKVF